MTSSTLIWMMDVTIRSTSVLDMTMKKVRLFLHLLDLDSSRLDKKSSNIDDRLTRDDSFSYPLTAARLLRSHVKGNKALIVTNDLVAPLYLEKYAELLREGGNLEVDTLVLPDGEEYKNMEIMQTILDKCLENTLDRKATLVALGGGVIGDMVGFAAAIYQRGVNFIQIPTTVMAMVDSSVGGKTGVNHPAGKNMIGAFHQPQCVFIDTDNLSTLPDRELASGISEIIKYGLIRDAPFFEWQEEHMEEILSRKPDALRFAITRSCQNKAAVVKADEKEAGVRATLNLGHTFGHAIENGAGYGTYLHGEAVSIGTAMAASMSARMGWIDSDMVQRIYKIMESAKLPLELPPDSPMSRERFLKLMSVDKKVDNGQLRLILLKGDLGNCVFTGDFDEQAMIETIDEFVAECDGARVSK
jgi:3-dehydroquinate synthase